jgi:hypothetical protein
MSSFFAQETTGAPKRLSGYGAERIATRSPQAILQKRETRTRLNDGLGIQGMAISRSVFLLDSQWLPC